MNSPIDNSYHKHLRWFLENKDLHSWTISEMLWEKWNNKKFHDVYVEGLIEETTVFGRGSDVDPMIAVMKSIHEFIERVTCLENKISTNGVGTHYIKECAENFAINELIERHVVGVHFENKIPFEKIKYSSKFLNKVMDKCDIGIYRSWNQNGLCAYIIRGEVKGRGGYVYNTGTVLDESLELQFLRKFYALSESNFDTDNEVQRKCLSEEMYGFVELFNSKSKHSFFQHVEVTTIELKSNYKFPFYTIKAESKDVSEFSSLKNFIIG